MNKRILSALAFAAPFAVFAEGESGSSSGMQVVNEVTTSLTTFLQTATPVVVTVVTAGVALWAGFALVPLIKRAWKMFTGR